MRNLIISGLAFTALAASAQAQFTVTARDIGANTLIGGWDFNAVGTATSANTLNARYNQQYSPYFGSGSSGSGPAGLNATLYFTNADFGATFVSNRNFNVSNAPVYDIGTDGLLVSNDSLGDSGGTNFRSVLLSRDDVLDNARAVFRVQTITTFNVFEDINVAYSVRNQGSADAVISWSYSLDGGSTFVDIAGTAQTIAPSGASWSVYTADFSAVTAVEGVENLLIGLNYSEVNAGASVFLDNVAIYGVASAIPEPSAFAGIAGLCGLGFAAMRRRRA